MSAATRTAIADAASTVTGVTCTPYYRQSLRPGDACVRLARRDRDASRLGWIDTWQVWLALPQDVAAAEAWLDAHMADLVAALRPELVVTSIAPAELVLGANTVSGAVIEGARAGA